MLRGKGRWIRACAWAFCLKSALATAGPLDINTGVEPPPLPSVDATPATRLSISQAGVQLANLAQSVLSEVRSAGAPVLTRTDSDLIAYATDAGTASTLPGRGQRRSAVNSGGLDAATAMVEGADGQIMLVHEALDAAISLLFPHPRAESAPEEKPADYRPVGAADYAAAEGRAAEPAEDDDGDGGLIKRRTKRSKEAAKECR